MDALTALKIRLQSLKTTLDESAPEDCTKTITKKMASHFNEIRQAIIKARPEVADHLPKEIKLTIPKNELYYYDHPEASYFDLRTFVNELIGVLTHLETEK